MNTLPLRQLAYLYDVFNASVGLECDFEELNHIMKRLKELSTDIQTAGCFVNETQRIKFFDWMHDIDDLKCQIEHLKNDELTNVKPSWFR